jgi:hypothetical protein
MENIDTTIGEIQGYIILYPGSPGAGKIVGINGGDGQYIGQFPTNTPGSTAKVGRQTDSMVLAKPDSERWWSTRPYVPPLH